jgi:hypothetical protein
VTQPCAKNIENKKLTFLLNIYIITLNTGKDTQGWTTLEINKKQCFHKIKSKIARMNGLVMKKQLEADSSFVSRS